MKKTKTPLKNAKKDYYKIKPTAHRCLPDVWNKFRKRAKRHGLTANAALNRLIEYSNRTDWMPGFTKLPKH